MKKLNLLFAIALLFSGCATNQDINDQAGSTESVNSAATEQDHEEAAPIIDHTSMNYEIEEIPVPEELKAENYDFFVAIQDDHATSKYINFQLLSKENSGFYTSEALYKYTFKTQTLDKIEDFTDEEIRVWDVIEDEKGNQYELVEFHENNSTYCEVRYNGNSIIKTNPQSYFNLRQFEKLGEEIYLLAEDIVDESHTKWLVMHLDGEEVEIIDEITMDRTGMSEEDYPTLIVPNIQVNSNNWFSYVTEQDGKYTVHSFNQDEKITFEVPEAPRNVIILKDYILVDVSRRRDSVVNPEEAVYKQYSYNVKTKELKEAGDEEIGLTIQVSDNEFYSADNFVKTKLYHFDGKELKSKVIEETPKESLAQRAVRIDDETDFVKLEDTDGRIHFYLIYWKK